MAWGFCLGTSSKIKTRSFPFEIKRSPFICSKRSKSKISVKIFNQIEHLLNANEIDLIRRARNKTKRYPKSSDPIYSRATGFETLIGWLFQKILKDYQLFEYLEIQIQ